MDKVIIVDENIAIVHDSEDDEYYVFDGERLARVCPSIGMAHEVAAGLSGDK